MNVTLPDFSKGRTLVVGDVMLDRYWNGSTSRISPEAPVPVVHINKEEERAGGAANVALNIASLGGQVVLLGFVGDDDEATRLQLLLEDRGVECLFLKRKGKRTLTKLRVVSQHQQLIRLDFEESKDAYEWPSLKEQFQEMLASCDAAVLSDYGKGTLCDVPSLIDYARGANIPVLVDPKGTDFNKYRGATLITPNLSEFTAVVGSCEGKPEIVELGEQLRKELELEALLVTLGEDGMLLLESQKPPFHQPTHAREVFDVTGAGDTVIATMAASLSAGVGLHESMVWANMAAGIVVGKLGTATTTCHELREAAQPKNKMSRGILSEDELFGLVKNARARGEKIVMTNGCFDILHPGHVSYLEEAAALGDRLIVAVNDDESVRRLKGDQRPINSLEQRMIMLSALACVDSVVSFSEDTPKRLYCAVQPDVLVKGGDYQPEDVAGGECVEKNGGEVVIVKFVNGYSTTDIVRRISSNVLPELDCQ